MTDKWQSRDGTSDSGAKGDNCTLCQPVPAPEEVQQKWREHITGVTFWKEAIKFK